MGQEFIIKSQRLEDKVNQLLPSQGGFQAGIDLSASTQIVPIVDLTESAEGSLLRSDLQRAYGLNVTTFDVSNGNSTILTTTGYFRIIGFIRGGSTSDVFGKLQIADGFTTKDIINIGTRLDESVIPIDVTIFLSAGQSAVVIAETNCQFTGTARQIATIDGDLVNP